MVWKRRDRRDMGHYCGSRRSVRRHDPVGTSFAHIATVTYVSDRYHYTGSAFAVTEPDGIRIISSDVCDLIQKVPGMVKVKNLCSETDDL